MQSVKSPMNSNNKLSVSGHSKPQPNITSLDPSPFHKKGKVLDPSHKQSFHLSEKSENIFEFWADCGNNHSHISMKRPNQPLPARDAPHEHPDSLVFLESGFQKSRKSTFPLKNSKGPGDGIKQAPASREELPNASKAQDSVDNMQHFRSFFEETSRKQLDSISQNPFQQCSEAEMSMPRARTPKKPTNISFRKYKKNADFQRVANRKNLKTENGPISANQTGTLKISDFPNQHLKKRGSSEIGSESEYLELERLCKDKFGCHLIAEIRECIALAAKELDLEHKKNQLKIDDFTIGNFKTMSYHRPNLKRTKLDPNQGAIGVEVRMGPADQGSVWTSGPAKLQSGLLRDVNFVDPDLQKLVGIKCGSGGANGEQRTAKLEQFNNSDSTMDLSASNDLQADFDFDDLKKSDLANNPEKRLIKNIFSQSSDSLRPRNKPQAHSSSKRRPNALESKLSGSQVEAELSDVLGNMLGWGSVGTERYRAQIIRSATKTLNNLKFAPDGDYFLENIFNLVNLQFPIKQAVVDSFPLKMKLRIMTLLFCKYFNRCKVSSQFE